MRKIIRYIFIMGVVIIINSPSLKLLYSTELINILGFIWIMTAFLYRLFVDKISVHMRLVRIIITFSVYFLFLLISALWSPASIAIIDILKYLQVYLLFITVLLSFNKDDLIIYIKWQIGWSTILAILHLLGIVQTNLALGQHYLTVGLPLGLGLVGLIGLSWEYINSDKSKRLWLHAILATIIASDLFSLRGRSPILMFVLVIYLFGILLMLFNPNRLRNLTLILIISLLIYFLFINFTSDILMSRFTELFQNVESEPRYGLYRYTIKMIMENPLGYGLESFPYYTGSSYPHNIFLESLFYGGIQSLIFVLPIFRKMIKVAIKSVKNKKLDLIVVSMMAVYVFLVWNISFNLTSSYVVFTIIAVQLSAGNTVLEERL